MSAAEHAEEIRSLRRQGLSLQEIGDHYGVSRERIRQIAGDVLTPQEIRGSVSLSVTPIELEIYLIPNLVRLSLCEEPRCCRPAEQEIDGRPYCSGHQGQVRYRSDPRRRERHKAAVKSWAKRNREKVREINRRASRGRCPICCRDYVNIRSHIRRVHPDGDYRALLSEARREIMEAR